VSVHFLVTRGGGGCWCDGDGGGRCRSRRFFDQYQVPQKDFQFYDVTLSKSPSHS
jgi:hypothetical protein